MAGAAGERLRTIENARPSARLKSPLTISLIGLVLIYLLSTWFSIDPLASWRGSYDNQQGTWTFLCYVLIGGALASGLRRPEQIERCFTVIIAGSLPVALYALVQRAGYDPVHLTRLSNAMLTYQFVRVTSTMGTLSTWRSTSRWSSR